MSVGEYGCHWVNRTKTPITRYELKDEEPRTSTRTQRAWEKSRPAEPPPPSPPPPSLHLKITRPPPKSFHFKVTPRPEKRPHRVATHYPRFWCEKYHNHPLPPKKRKKTRGQHPPRPPRTKTLSPKEFEAYAMGLAEKAEKGIHESLGGLKAFKKRLKKRLKKFPYQAVDQANEIVRNLSVYSRSLERIESHSQHLFGTKTGHLAKLSAKKRHEKLIAVMESMAPKSHPAQQENVKAFLEIHKECPEEALLFVRWRLEGFDTQVSTIQQKLKLQKRAIAVTMAQEQEATRHHAIEINRRETLLEQQLEDCHKLRHLYKLKGIGGYFSLSSQFQKGMDRSWREVDPKFRSLAKREEELQQHSTIIYSLYELIRKLQIACFREVHSLIEAVCSKWEHSGRLDLPPQDRFSPNRAPLLKAILRRKERQVNELRGEVGAAIEKHRNGRTEEIARLQQICLHLDIPFQGERVLSQKTQRIIGEFEESIREELRQLRIGLNRTIKVHKSTTSYRIEAVNSGKEGYLLIRYKAFPSKNDPHGTFKQCLLSMDYTKGEKRALLRFKPYVKTPVPYRSMRHAFEAEMANLRLIAKWKVPHTPQFFDVDDDILKNGNLCMLQEHGGEDLFVHMQKLKKLPTNHPDRLRLAGRIARVGAEAAAVIHSHGHLYLDMKAENFLLDEKGRILLTDFAFMQRQPESDGINRVCGTLGTIPPEVVNREHVTTAADVYSLGATLFEILYGVAWQGEGQINFENGDLTQQLRSRMIIGDQINREYYAQNPQKQREAFRVEERAYRLTTGHLRPTDRLSSLDGLLVSMLSHHADRRPTMRQVLHELDRLGM